MDIYQIPGLPPLTVETLHSVDNLGIPNTCKFISHSRRYGGATMLLSAGFPHYIIAIYGGWSEDSKILQRYTRHSDSMLELVSAHMSRMAKSDSVNFFVIDAFMIAKAK